MLGISRIAVFKKVKNGKLAALRFGRNWAVSAEVVRGLGSAVSRPVLPPPVKGFVAAEASAPTIDNEMDSMGWD